VMNRDESGTSRVAIGSSLGWGVALAGWSGMELEEAGSSGIIQRGLFRREFTKRLSSIWANALGGSRRLRAIGLLTLKSRLCPARSGSYQPAFFTQINIAVIAALPACCWASDTAARSWMKLPNGSSDASDSVAVRAAAHALSTAHHTLAGSPLRRPSVRRLEDFDPATISREGLLG